MPDYEGMEYTQDGYYEGGRCRRAYRRGYNEGYSRGYSEGYKRGYQNGCRDCGRPGYPGCPDGRCPTRPRRRGLQ